MPMNRKSYRDTVVVALAMLTSLGIVSDAKAWCMQQQDTATVCADGYCWTTIYYHETCTFGGGDDGGGDPPSGPGGGGPGNYYDQDGDGYIDEWRGVVSTDDPCANNFDLNDRLGTEYGGINDVRPGHGGVDIQANRYDAVYPFRSGTVNEVGWDAGALCGYRVVIDHDDGTKATYCHMQDRSSTLTPGQYVHAGWTQIGQVNNTGRSTGDHLHIAWSGADGSRWEYFSCTDSQPLADQLTPGGC